MQSLASARANGICHVVLRLCQMKPEIYTMEKCVFFPDLHFILKYLILCLSCYTFDFLCSKAGYWHTFINHNFLKVNRYTVRGSKSAVFNSAYLLNRGQL